MQLIEQNVVVTTRFGQMPAFAVCPAQGGPFPPVLFYMDAPGIREELHNMARRIAKAGYYVLLPDLYYRLGKVRFDITRRDEAMSKVIWNCITSIDTAKMMDDTAAMIAFIDGQSQVRPGPVGCIGFCMGGKYVVSAAGTYPERIAAVAALYGIQLVTDDADSPHLLAPRIDAELFFGFAETDRSAPPAMVQALGETLCAATVAHDIQVYPGTVHGYCFAESDKYTHAAAEDSWARIFALFARKLGSSDSAA
jgi:carboxymethylenebutenolidase